jgi:hypothetical protein
VIFAADATAHRIMNRHGKRPGMGEKLLIPAKGPMPDRLLGNCGLRVSEPSLGTMTFGEDWGWGTAKDESRKVYDAFPEAGGNFIDPPMFTQMAAARLRAPTSAGCTSGTDSRRSKTSCALSTTSSARAKCLRRHLRCPRLVGRASKHAHSASGMVAFVGLPVEYSLMERTPERELMPVAQALDIGFSAWSPLAGGVLTGKYHRHSSSEQSMSTDLMKQFLPEQQRADPVVAAGKNFPTRLAGSMAQVWLVWLRLSPDRNCPTFSCPLGSCEPGPSHAKKAIPE